MYTIGFTGGIVEQIQKVVAAECLYRWIRFVGYDCGFDAGGARCIFTISAGEVRWQ